VRTGPLNLTRFHPNEHLAHLACEGTEYFDNPEKKVPFERIKISPIEPYR
jgi:hypothetical protein